MRDQLRQMLEEDQKREPGKRQHRLLERAEFDRLCDEVGGISDKEALLDFLHHNGVIFYRPGLFGNRIVLDQNWALEAIYAIFDRKSRRVAWLPMINNNYTSDPGDYHCLLSLQSLASGKISCVLTVLLGIPCSHY